MVAAEVRSGLQSVAAFTFAADQLPLGLALHRAFADQAAVTKEAVVTAAAAKGVTLIGDGRGQLHAAMRIAAVMPLLHGETRSMVSPNEKPGSAGHRSMRNGPEMAGDAFRLLGPVLFPRRKNRFGGGGALLVERLCAALAMRRGIALERYKAVMRARMPHRQRRVVVDSC